MSKVPFFTLFLFLLSYLILYYSFPQYAVLNLKFELGFEKLAIALYGKNANEAIALLCQSLLPIQTRLFAGGRTTQELIAQINAWLSEM